MGTLAAEHDDMLYGEVMDPESLQMDDKQKTKIRNGLVRKVYGILLTQLAMSTVLAAAFTLNGTMRTWILTNSWVMILSAIGAISTLIALQCVPGLSRKHPTNIYLLFGFTLAESICLGGVCASVAAQGQMSAVLQALVITAFLILGLTFYALQTSKDFTQTSGMLVILTMALIGFGALRFIFPRSSALETIFAVMGALLFGAYIVVDTQRLVGNKAVSGVTEDDYICISLELYADMIGLFMNVLRLLTSNRDD